VGAASRAGVPLVQVREAGLDGRRLAELVRRCLDAVDARRTRVVVNDRLDVALAAGAHGVHLREDSIPASRVRAVAPAGFLVGRSVHSTAAAREASGAGGLDYLIFGTVFPSASKPGGTAAGVHALAGAVTASSVPLLAIGGVMASNAGDVAGTGAAGFAAIDLFATGDDAELPRVVAQARATFAAGWRPARPAGIEGAH